MEISELVNEIGYLKEYIKIVEDNVKFHLQIQWGALAFVVAAAGAALYFLAKIWFNSIVDKKVKEAEKNLHASFMDEIQKLENRFEGLRFEKGAKIIDCRTHVTFKRTFSKLIMVIVSPQDKVKVENKSTTGFDLVPSEKEFITWIAIGED